MIRETQGHENKEGDAIATKIATGKTTGANEERGSTNGRHIVT